MKPVAFAAIAACVVWASCRAGSPAAADAPASIRIETARRHQTLDGFGATHVTLVHSGRDELSPVLRARALAAVYGQVRMTMGILDPVLLEGRDGSAPRGNDNDDPFRIDWSGFQTADIDAIVSGVLKRPEAQGFTAFQISARINTRWASPWLAALRSRDYQRYLDEAAEQVVAACTYWRDRYGIVTPIVQLFNEPLSGNAEVAHGGTQDLVDLVQRAGDRLRAAGFDSVRFVVPNEETEEKSLESARAILASPGARPYVAAIGYHPYPHGSVYANIGRLLDTSGSGHPDAARLRVRRQLWELARQYGVPVWMTEVSMGGVDARSYDDFRGRAIHIHDELTYANASAYFGMNSMWDRQSHAAHFGWRRPFFREEGNIVLLENASDTVVITGMGYAIGHYARWLHKGAVRIEAVSDDPLLLATAFRDESRRRLVIVLINNAGRARPVSVAVAGGRLEGTLAGEQSTPQAYWVPVDGLPAPEPGRFTLEVPGLSVTTLAVGFSASP